MVYSSQDSSIIDKPSTIFWFRRDLRLDDNAGLYHALTERKNVVGLFIFDTNILDRLDERADRRVEFIHHALQHLKAALEKTGSSLMVLHGDPVSIYSQLDPGTVYPNED